jgi:hypothetical protein
MGSWPEKVHVLTPGARGGSSSPHITAHRAPRPFHPVIVIDGVLATDLSTTLVDIAVAHTLETSVPMLDHALARAPRGEREKVRGEWMDLLSRLAPKVYGSRASRALLFANGLSGSPGESLSRVLIDRGGFAAPELQREVRVNGQRYFADFAWDGVIGEYDGRDKYRDPEMLRGRSPDQVRWEEKRREDAIRLSTGCRFVRWGAEEVFHAEALWRLLRLGGVPLGRR